VNTLATKAERAVHVYELPENLLVSLGTDKWKSVTLVELTAAEEQAAMKRCKSDPMRLAVEFAKQALVEVNGEKVSLGNQSVDRAWDEFPSKMRSLVMSAYNEIHNPSEEEQAGFLKSRTTRVGK